MEVKDGQGKKVWVITAKSSIKNKLKDIFQLKINKTELSYMLQSMNLGEVDSIINGIDSIEEINDQALIEEDSYYIDFGDAKKLDLLEPSLQKLYSLVLEDDTINTSHVFSFKHEDFESNERPRMIVVKYEKDNDYYWLIYYIDSRGILNKKGKMKNLLDGDFNNNASIYTVNLGIPVPEAVTAIFSISNKRLFVVDVKRFESMLYLNDSYRSKAKNTVSEFVNGNKTVSRDDYKVKGLANPKVMNQLYGENSKVRLTRRIAKYSGNDKEYGIEDIKRAVMQIKDESKRVRIDDSKREIIVNNDNVETFVGIIHDSIVKRLLSGEVDVV